MAKRDTDTELWNEDWFLELKGKGQLFYYYIKDKCDHAGFWRPNFKIFEQSTGFRIRPKDFLDMINTDNTTGEKKHRERIRVLENGRWWIVGYIAFHFPVLNINNRYHKSVYETFRKNVTCLNTECYGFEVKDTSKTPLREVKKTSREQGTENREQREKIFIEDINEFTQYHETIRNDFIKYWTELNKSKTKMKFELQQTWETSKRLSTWANRNKDFKQSGREQQSKNEYPEQIKIPLIKID